MKKSFTKILLCTAACSIALTAHAQTSSDTEMEPFNAAEDEVIATGIRQSLQQSVDMKRNASVIADVISATDIGRFPDENVAESLQRITGVQIQRRRGEGSQVNIRGLPSEFTYTSLNGRPIASAFTAGAASRSFEFGALPSEFVNALEVYKTSQAELEEGGLSGTVIVRTPRPLSVGKRTFAASAQLAHESNSGEFAPRISGLYTDVLADGRLGIALGAAYTKRRPETQSAIARGFRQSRQGVQNLIIYDRFNETRERLNLLGTVEFEATPDFKVYAEGFYTDLTIDAPRQSAEFYFGNTFRDNVRNDPDPFIAADSTQVTFGDGRVGYSRAGLNDVQFRAGSRYEDRKGDTISLAFGGDWDNGGPWRATAEAAYSNSEQVTNGYNLAVQNNIESASYDLTQGDVPQLTFSQSALDDLNTPSNYRILSFNGSANAEIVDEIYDVKLDIERDFSENITLKFGGKYTDRAQTGTNPQIRLTGQQYEALTGLPRNDASPYIRFVGASSGSFLGSFDGPAQFPTEFPVGATTDFIDEFGIDNILAAGTLNANEAAIVDVSEKVMAGYAQLDFTSRSETVSGNVGVRVVHTEQESVGFGPDLANIQILPESGGDIIIPSGGSINVERDYTNILPSANLRINVSEDLIARLAASRTMARPTLQQLSPSTRAVANPPSIVQQNPFLDPFLATNLDASLEWYFGEGALLSATVFYKDLESLITPDSEIQSLTITQVNGDGSQQPFTTDFNVDSVINGDGANVKGIELSYQQPFSNLPGLFRHTGAIVNYTYIDNSNPEEITGASKHNFNLSGYYEADKLSARVSYTWRDTFLLDFFAQERFGRFVQSVGFVDANVTYDINDNFSVVVESINLLDTPTVMLDGEDFPAIYEDSGRRLLFGVRAKF